MSSNTHCYEEYSTDQGLNSFPPNAIEVNCHDVDGSTIYLGRVLYEGDVLPAKVIPSKNAAYISHGGQEILVNTVEVLCAKTTTTLWRRLVCKKPHSNSKEYSWLPARDGNVPDNAVIIGSTGDEEDLYAGRAVHDCSITPGKVHPSHKCLYIPFNGEEIAVKNYEVLCWNKNKI